MRELLTQLVNDPWFGFSGLVLSVVSLVLAFFFYKRGTKRKQLAFGSRTFVVVDEQARSLPSLRIAYNGTEVRCLTVTTLLLWNSGNDAVRDTDFPSSNELRIVPTADGEILDCGILDATADSNRATAELSQKTGEIRIGFEYLDPNDGLVLKVLHSANKVGGLQIFGKIIGGSLVSKRLHHVEPEDFLPGWIHLRKEITKPVAVAFATTVSVALVFLAGVAGYLSVTKLGSVESTVTGCSCGFLIAVAAEYVRKTSCLIRPACPRRLLRHLGTSSVAMSSNS